jgi:hypothetical protein
MNEKLKERLNKILPRIESKEFLEGRGLGNEIGFYIFDYPPEEEVMVRDHIRVILDNISTRKPELRIKNVNLFELLLDYLKKRNLFDPAVQLQKKRGNEEALKALSAPLHEEKIAKVFSDAVPPDEYDLVFITGVGNAWPLLRSHTLLSNLHPLLEQTPLVMFYPGVYDGQSLSLFGKLKDNNYYRAFQLVE